MKKNTLRKFALLFAVLTMAASFSSCNRGYGCPNNFSVGDVVTNVVTQVVATPFQK